MQPADKPIDELIVVAMSLGMGVAFALAVADARADGGDHRLDFLVLEHFLETRFLRVDEFAGNGGNSRRML